MDFEHLPPNIERDVERLANDWQVTHDEAVLRLIQDGLDTHRHARSKSTQGKVDAKSGSEKKPGEALIGLMSSPKDSAMMEDILVEAMASRRRRWKRLSRAKNNS